MTSTTQTPDNDYAPRHVEPHEILVAIPTFNEENYIRNTIENLMTGAAALSGVAIVVSDGGSEDGTREIVSQISQKYRNVTLITNPLKRQGAGVNLVVEKCAHETHRVLVRCDAHAHYPPNYILKVADSLIEHDADAVATVMDAVGENGFQRGAAFAVDTLLGSGGSGHRGGKTSGVVDHGHHAGFQLDIWQKTKGYNPDYAANQDAELDHRIVEAGGKIWLDAEIRMQYFMRPNLKSLSRQYWLYGRGRARTVFTHRTWPKPRQLAPAALTLGFFCALPVSFAYPMVALLPVAYLFLLAMASVGISVSRKSFCGFFSGPALFAMHMSWGAGFLFHAVTRQSSAA